MTFFRETLTTVAIALTFIAFLPYIFLILKGNVKPHVFSWVIWSITTITVFFAQIDEGAGVAAWSTGVSGCVTIFIACLAFIKRADITILPIDWVFLLAAMISLPLWYVSSGPLWTVVILTSIDVTAFGPTVRKTYVMPYSESIIFFAIFAVRDSLVIAALEYYSFATVLFPAAIAISCLFVIIMMLYRRRVIRRVP